MQNLIKINPINFNNQTINSVSAREVHKFLECTERFNSWFDRMVEYGFECDLDFTTVKDFTLVNNGAKREIQDYLISLEMAKEICMLQRSDKGKQARQYFIDCEKQLNQQKLPTNRELALMVIAEADRADKAEAKVKLLTHQNKLYTSTELAKECGFKSAQELNKELESRKIQYKVNRTWVLAARYANCGYVSIKQDELENGTVIYDRKWTGLGRDFILSIFEGIAA